MKKEIYEMLPPQANPQPKKIGDVIVKKKGRDMTEGDIFVDEIEESPGKRKKMYMQVQKIEKLENGAKIVHVKSMYPVEE